jgi:subtilisin family serine protease/subtilisin-like proprotein convertase family protein
MSDRRYDPVRQRAKLSVEVLEDRTTPSALSIDSSSYASDHVLVSLSSTATPASAGLTNSPLVTDVHSIGLGLYQVNLVAGVSVGQAISVFSGANGVLFAEPDYTVGLQLTPNDPSYGSLWGLNNTGQSGGVADADIDAPEAWDSARGTGQTIVAVIDTGVDYNHQDLNANMWRNPGETPGNGVDDDGNGWVDDVFGADFANNDGNPMDDNNHGTHVAGTIGAVGNNGIGVTGVAWTTKIMALKFLSASGSGSTSNAVRAIDYAIAKGAKILNNSWGGGGYSLSLDQAITRAQNAGVIFVAAAGNSATNNDTTPNYPSNYPQNNVVAVASTTRTDTMSSFSSYGATTVDLGAPGSSILSTTPNNTYSTFSGTSMATPHVAGALAVYWDANPTLTYSQVIQKLLQSVDPIAALAGRTVTGGRLNLRKMLEGTSPPPSPPPPPSDTTGARVTAGAFAGQAASTFDRVRVTFNEPINSGSFDTTDIVSLTGPGGAITPTAVTLVSGTNNQFDVKFASQSAVGAYSIVLGPNILDVAGNTMDQNQDGQNGQSNDTYSLTNNLAPPRVVFTPNTALPAAIRDFQTTTITFIVPSTSPLGTQAITDVNVNLSLTHTYLSDLRITLKSPTGQSVRLFNRRGGSADNLTNTTFDDEATTPIANGSAPFTGSFKPEQLLSAFDGRSAVGTWTLQVQDLASLDTGNVTAASISISVGPGGQMVQTFGASDETPAETPRLLKDDSMAPVPAFLSIDFAPPQTPALVPPAGVPSLGSAGVRVETSIAPLVEVKPTEPKAEPVAFDTMSTPVRLGLDWLADDEKPLVLVI